MVTSEHSVLIPWAKRRWSTRHSEWTEEQVRQRDEANTWAPRQRGRKVQAPALSFEPWRCHLLEFWVWASFITYNQRMIITHQVQRVETRINRCKADGSFEGPHAHVPAVLTNVCLGGPEKTLLSTAILSKERRIPSSHSGAHSKTGNTSSSSSLGQTVLGIEYMLTWHCPKSISCIL